MTEPDIDYGFHHLMQAVLHVLEFQKTARQIGPLGFTKIVRSCTPCMFASSLCLLGGKTWSVFAEAYIHGPVFADQDGVFDVRRFMLDSFEIAKEVITKSDIDE